MALLCVRITPTHIYTKTLVFTADEASVRGASKDARSRDVGSALDAYIGLADLARDDDDDGDDHWPIDEDDADETATYLDVHIDHAGPEHDVTSFLKSLRDSYVRVTQRRALDEPVAPTRHELEPTDVARYHVSDTDRLHIRCALATIFKK